MENGPTVSNDRMVPHSASDGVVEPADQTAGLSDRRSATCTIIMNGAGLCVVHPREDALNIDQCWISVAA